MTREIRLTLKKMYHLPSMIRGGGDFITVFVRIKVENIMNDEKIKQLRQEKEHEYDCLKLPLDTPASFDKYCAAIKHLLPNSVNAHMNVLRDEFTILTSEYNKGTTATANTYKKYGSVHLRSGTGICNLKTMSIPKWEGVFSNHSMSHNFYDRCCGQNIYDGEHYTYLSHGMYITQDPKQSNWYYLDNFYIQFFMDHYHFYYKPLKELVSEIKTYLTTLPALLGNEQAFKLFCENVKR